MKWLIKNGTIASEEKTFLADLLLEDDKIIKIEHRRRGSKVY